jgi:hypothetical protein
MAEEEPGAKDKDYEDDYEEDCEEGKSKSNSNSNSNSSDDDDDDDLEPDSLAEDVGKKAGFTDIRQMKNIEKQVARCLYCAFGWQCKVSKMGIIDVKLCNSCQITTFMSNYVKSFHSSQIMSFMSNHVTNVICH